MQIKIIIVFLILLIGGTLFLGLVDLSIPQTFVESVIKCT